MEKLTLQEAFKIIDLKLENGNSLKNVLSTMAIENMFVSEEFLMELISVKQGNKKSEQGLLNALTLKRNSGKAAL